MIGLIFVVNNLLLINAMVAEDVNSLFAHENCIEASLLSQSYPQEVTVMLDKDSFTTLQETNIINITEITPKEYDKTATSKVNELAQYNNIKFTYELLSEEGPPHKRNYKIALVLGDEKYEGSGSSEKAAKNAAANLALSNTYYEHPPIQIKTEQEKFLTPTVILNNIAMKFGISVSYYLITDKNEQEITDYGALNEPYGKAKSYFKKLNASGFFRIPTEEPQIVGPFTVRVKVGDFVFVGMGETIQSARHNAASEALKNMEKQILNKENVCLDNESVESCKERKENLKSPISRIYEAGQKQNLNVEFNVISESGKSHKKNFVIQCKLGSFISEGVGKSKKEAKKSAAEKMLENFKFLPQILNEKEIINGLKTKKKKKKNKVIKKLSRGTVLQTLTNVLDNFWITNKPLGDNPNTKTYRVQKKGTNEISPKDKLLEVSNKLGISIEFVDLSNSGDSFYSLMLLGVQPSQVCLGKASSREKSHHDAALHGLKFLTKSGMFDKTELIPYEDESVYIGDDSLIEDNLIHHSTEDQKEN